MRDPVGFVEFGKKHSQVYLEKPGLCPACLDRYIDGRDGGAKTQLIEEVVGGKKTGKWICPDGGQPYGKQLIDAGDGKVVFRVPVIPPIL